MFNGPADLVQDYTLAAAFSGLGLVLCTLPFFGFLGISCRCLFARVEGWKHLVDMVAVSKAGVWEVDWVSSREFGFYVCLQLLELLELVFPKSADLPEEVSWSSDLLEW